MIQIARRLTKLRVVATRVAPPTTVAWCERMGAHDVIDHHGRHEGRAHTSLGVVPRYVARSHRDDDRHFPFAADVLAPAGEVRPHPTTPDPSSIDIGLLKQKSPVAALGVHVHPARCSAPPTWTPQHRLLNRVADAVDDGTLVTTANRAMGTIDAANLREAHKFPGDRCLRSGMTVMEGF